MSIEVSSSTGTVLLRLAAAHTVNNLIPRSPMTAKSDWPTRVTVKPVASMKTLRTSGWYIAFAVHDRRDPQRGRNSVTRRSCGGNSGPNYDHLLLLEVTALQVSIHLNGPLVIGLFLVFLAWLDRRI
jgi:hypothetical protein